jgi:PAS domain S-box-containing protein
MLLMQFQYSPYVFPLIAAATIASWVAVYAWANRRSSGSAIALCLLALAIAQWSLGYMLEIASIDTAAKLLWGKSQYIGIAIVPLAWLIFAITHAYQSRRVTVHNAFILSLVPVITIVLALTTEGHGLIWREIALFQTEHFSVLDVSYGPWFWVHSIYSYGLLLYGAILIVRSLGRMQGVYRGQAVALLIGVAAPWVGNILYLADLTPIPHLDLTPLTFALTTVALAWGIFGFHLMDMAPLARDLIVHEMQDAVIVLDVEGRIVDLNPEAERLIGRDVAPAVGKTAVEVFAAWPQIVHKYESIADTSDEIVIDAGDIQGWYEIRIAALRDRRKHFIGRVVIIRDITERKLADEQLRQLSRAVEASPTSIVITDTQGDIEYVNPKFTQVTGYSIHEALGQNPRILKTTQTPPEVHIDLWQAVTAGKEWRGEFCNRKKNGELYWEFVSISPIIDAHGNITHYVAVKEDITERKHAEAELQRYTTELEASNAELDAFAHTVAHDLKNPLTTLLGFSMLLQTHHRRMPPERIDESLRMLTRSGQKMTSIIDELLLLASVRKMGDVPLGPLDMAAIVAETCERLSPMILEYQAALVTPETWPVPVGYASWIEEVWVNYISNALKYGGRPEGNIPPRVELGWDEVVTATLSDQAPVPQYFRFWVQDNGVGLPPEQTAQLFTQFTRLHQVRIEGHGLGLSIARRIVEKFGGTVGVESRPGEGCRFYFTLPASPPSPVV